MSKICSRMTESGIRDFIVEPEEEVETNPSPNHQHHEQNPLLHQSQSSRRSSSRLITTREEEEGDTLRRSRLRGLSSGNSRRSQRSRSGRSVVVGERRRRPAATDPDSDQELYDTLFGDEELLTLQIADHHHQHHHHNNLAQNQNQNSTDRPSISVSGNGSGHGQLAFDLDSNLSNLNLNTSSTTTNSTNSTMNPSLSLQDRNRVHHHHHHAHHNHHGTHHESTASLLDSMERRTQRTYRYGIGLVCVGATLNWLGFAQGHGYVDPLRYLGVACVISGSFCVCLAMCRWLGRPISVSSHHHVTGLSPLDYQDERNGGRHHQNGDVHVINVSVPMYVPHMHEEYRPTKPPDYEIAVAGEPPPYDEAIKLRPTDLFAATTTSSSPPDKGTIQNPHANNANSTNSASGTSGNVDSSYFSCTHPSLSSSQQVHQHQSQGQQDPNLSVVQTHSQGQVQTHHGSSPPIVSQVVASASTIVGTVGGDGYGQSNTSSLAEGQPQGQSQGQVPSHSSGVSISTHPAPSNNLTSTSLAESNHQSPYRSNSAFRPDGVVVVVDASESANPILINSNNNHLHSVNSVKAGTGTGPNHLNINMGAPPPYTREYTPSPRRAPSTPTPNSNINSNTNFSADQLSPNSNNNNNYSITPVHSYHHPTNTNSSNNNQNQSSLVSSSSDNQNYSSVRIDNGNGVSASNTAASES